MFDQMGFNQKFRATFFAFIKIFILYFVSYNMLLNEAFQLKSLPTDITQKWANFFLFIFRPRMLHHFLFSSVFFNRNKQIFFGRFFLRWTWRTFLVLDFKFRFHVDFVVVMLISIEVMNENIAFLLEIVRKIQCLKTLITYFVGRLSK